MSARWLGGLLLLALVLGGLACAVGKDAPPARAVANRAFPPVPVSHRFPVVWAVGDGAAGTSIATWVGRRIAAGHPTRVLYLGDVYEEGTRAEFRSHMRGAYGRLLRRMWPTPGNHEWPAHPRGYDPFWSHITGRRTPPWYRTKVGAWAVLSLNSEAPHDKSSAQMKWLRATLRRHRDPCLVAFWHRPRFSAGRHGDQGDVAPLWNAVAGRAALVLNGHDHDLQRFNPVHGTTELVSGAGGQNLYRVHAPDRRLAFSNDSTFGAVRLVLGPRRADITFVTLTGHILDHASAPCRRTRLR